MLQAGLFEGALLDGLPFHEDGLSAARLDVGWREIAEALVVAAVIGVADEGHLAHGSTFSRTGTSDKPGAIEAPGDAWSCVKSPAKSCSAILKVTPPLSLVNRRRSSVYLLSSSLTEG